MVRECLLCGERMCDKRMDAFMASRNGVDMLLVSLLKSLALFDSITLGHHVDLKRELSCMNSYRGRIQKITSGAGVLITFFFFFFFCYF